VAQFTKTLPPFTRRCEEHTCRHKKESKDGLPDWAAVIHYGRELCWSCSSLESGKIREEPKEVPDERQA
jgi:hypothetical protein